MSGAVRAKNWLFDLLAHHHAERLRTHRAVERKMHHISMDDLPYPGAVTINQSSQTQPAPAPPPSKSWLLPIAAALGLATGGAGLGVATGLIPFAAPPAAPAPAGPIAPATPAAETVTWVSADGGRTWKQVPVSP